MYKKYDDPLRVKDTIEQRYAKLSNNWQFFMAMDLIFKIKKARGAYKNTCMWHKDYLRELGVHDDALYWDLLRLPRGKINILKLEVYKWLRRHGMYPSDQEVQRILVFEEKKRLRAYWASRRQSHA